jgi:hypothetical protein
MEANSNNLSKSLLDFLSLSSYLFPAFISLYFPIFFCFLCLCFSPLSLSFLTSSLCPKISLLSLFYPFPLPILFISLPTNPPNLLISLSPFFYSLILSSMCPISPFQNSVTFCPFECRGAVSFNRMAQNCNYLRQLLFLTMLSSIFSVLGSSQCSKSTM